MQFHALFVVLVELLILLGGVFFVVTLFKKSRANAIVTLGAASGDNETITVQFTNTDSDTLADQKQRVAEYFDVIQARKDFCHQRWLELRDAAIKENKDKQLKEVK